MCYYITAVLPPGTSQPVAQSVAEQYARNLTPLENPGVQVQLKAGELYCLTTTGHCDCGTSLGAVGRKRAPHQSSIEAKARKLATLGWSKAKISRALSQRAQSQERGAARALQLAAADADAWFAFITAIHSAGIPYIGLLLHSYSGPISGGFSLKARVAVQPGKQARDLLPQLAEDTLYEFRAEA